MTRRRRAAAEPVDSKHLRDLHNAMRKEWQQRRARRGEQPDGSPGPGRQRDPDPLAEPAERDHDDTARRTP